jgi:hypothetical protein
MNPDVTVNLRDEDAAARTFELAQGLYVIEGEPLFEVQRRGRQLFLELNMPRRSSLSGAARIRHASRPGWSADFGRHITEHWNNDQSTAHHKDVGILLAWCKGARVTSRHASIPVTDVAPTILSLFGIEPQPWHRPEKVPAFELAT